MPKNWRDCGTPPAISLTDLRAVITNGYGLSYNELKTIWREMIIMAGATDDFCSTEGGLNPSWSFIESLQQVVNYLEGRGRTTSWGNLVLVTVIWACPRNWELLFVVDYLNEAN